jgi:hypothetical protein
MKNKFIASLGLACALFSISSCKKDDKNSEPSIKAYTVPTTYNFGNANYTKSSQLVKMAVEVDAYLKKANSGTAVVSIDQTTLNNMFSNTGNAFSDASLNNSGINITSYTSEAALFKSYADSVIIFNTGANASAENGGFMPRGSNKIVVSPRGLEYGQAFTKGTMGALLFKEVVNTLTSIKSLSASDTTAAQAKWDAAFGYLAVPANYDPTKTYASTDADKPLLWGGYLAERGKAIDAGSSLFNAFLKGRAAIGGYDVNVRNQQIDIILAKWEQLAAAAALEYVTAPTASSAIGNYGTQFHALSEGFGFIVAFKYRPANSKLSASDYEKLKSILNKDFYTLVGETGFTDLVTAQNILKNTYGL